MKKKTVADRIKKLSVLIKDTDIEEIKYKKDGLKVGIKRMPPGSGGKEPPAGYKDKKETEKEEGKKKTAGKRIEEVFSHSVGHFRDYAPPSRKAFVKKGKRVEKGQKLGMIESMKIMKEILSPCHGRVRGKLVKHGDTVEYGQKLFEIEIV